MNVYEKAVIWCVVGCAVILGIGSCDVRTDKNRMELRLTDSNTRFVGEPIPSGDLMGCVAREQVFHNVDGSWASRLWIVRCPNSNTSATEIRGKAGNQTVVTTE